MDVVLKVPVKNFVYKYIKAKYGAPWRLEKKYRDGRMMIEFLERTPLRYEKFDSNEKILEIVVPSHIYMRNGCYLSQSRIDAFIEIVYQGLIEEIEQFYNSVTAGLGTKDCDRVKVFVKGKDNRTRERRIPPEEGANFFAQREIINDVLRKYDITEDDLTFDATKKKLQRTARNKN